MQRLAFTHNLLNPIVFCSLFRVFPPDCASLASKNFNDLLFVHTLFLWNELLVNQNTLPVSLSLPFIQAKFVLYFVVRLEDRRFV